jgi:hypothetical protein
MELDNQWKESAVSDTPESVGKPIFRQRITGLPSATIQKIAVDIYRATNAHGGEAPIRYEISREVWNTMQAEMMAEGYSIEEAIQKSRVVCGIPILIVEHLSDQGDQT